MKFPRWRWYRRVHLAHFASRKWLALGHIRRRHLLAVLRRLRFLAALRWCQPSALRKHRLRMNCGLRQILRPVLRKRRALTSRGRQKLDQFSEPKRGRDAGIFHGLRSQRNLKRETWLHSESHSSNLCRHKAMLT